MVAPLPSVIGEHLAGGVVGPLLVDAARLYFFQHIAVRVEREGGGVAVEIGDRGRHAERRRR